MTYQNEDLISWVKEIYRITLLFPKKEPLRYKLRELANEILEIFIFSRHENPGKKINEDLIGKIEVLNSFFEIAKGQNWVSSKEILEIQKNYQKLKEEIKDFENRQISITFPQTKVSQFRFNEREEKILEFLRERGKVQVSEVKKIFPSISKRTLRRDFQRLLKKGIIERIGEKNNTFYKLKDYG